MWLSKIRFVCYIFGGNYLLIDWWHVWCMHLLHCGRSPLCWTAHFDTGSSQRIRRAHITRHLVIIHVQRRWPVISKTQRNVSLSVRTDMLQRCLHLYPKKQKSVSVLLMWVAYLNCDQWCHYSVYRKVSVSGYCLMKYYWNCYRCLSIKLLKICCSCLKKLWCIWKITTFTVLVVVSEPRAFCPFYTLPTISI